MKWGKGGKAAMVAAALLLPGGALAAGIMLWRAWAKKRSKSAKG